MKLVSVNIDLMQVIITINKSGIIINADDVNAKYSLTKECVGRNLFGIQVILM